MFGSTIVMKAAKKGYKRYGIPGALVAGAGAFLGIRFIKRRFLSGDGDSEGADMSDLADSVTDAESGSSSD